MIFWSFGICDRIFSADEDVIQAVGEPMLGVLNTAHWTHDLQNPANADFVAAFRQKYAGRYPSVYAAMAYDTLMAMDAAVRDVGGKAYFEDLMAAFAEARADHIAVYGPDNHMRLTGKHETASIHQFSYGVADRGASIRVPHSFVNNGYRGYLEDRRPNSQGDPYQIASQILKTIAMVPTGIENREAA